MKLIYRILIIILIIFVIVIIASMGRQDIDYRIGKICFKENCFDIEIANDREERSKGLMFRKNLCSNCGMLFVYEEEVNNKFWMKNTLIPLDIIWLNSDLEVIYIANAVPCVTEKCDLYGPDIKKTKYVLEINSDKSKELGLEIGNKFILKGQ